MGARGGAEGIEAIATLASATVAFASAVLATAA